jgi:hypothetical protein
MSLSAIQGLRGRVSYPRRGENFIGQQPDDDPSRRVWVQTLLSLKGVEVKPTISDRFEFLAHLEFEERSNGESGEEPESGYPKIILSIPIMGKEISLLTGLIDRAFKLTGRVPEDHVTFAQVKENYARLVYSYEDLVYQLGQAHLTHKEHLRAKEAMEPPLHLRAG